MSATSHVFIDSSSDMDDILEEIAQILDSEVKTTQNPMCPYIFILKTVSLNCPFRHNDYELDDLSEQIYKFELEILPHDIDVDERVDALIEGAMYVFERFKSTAYFPVMAVFNLEKRLAEFIPEDC